MNYYPTLYGNMFPNSYGNPQPLTPKMEIIKVSGKNGAEAFQLAPNSSVLLLDETSPIIWFKTTDGAGYPTITPYTITPYTEPTPTNDLLILEHRITKIEERLNESNNNAKQCNKNDSADKSNENNVKRNAKS